MNSSTPLHAAIAPHTVSVHARSRTRSNATLGCSACAALRAVDGTLMPPPQAGSGSGAPRRHAPLRASRGERGHMTIDGNGERPRCLGRTGVPAAGREHHGERNEPDQPQSRPRESHHDQQQGEVVEPDDRRERERRGDRQHEARLLIALPCQENSRAQDGDPRTEPDRPSHARRQTEIQADDVRRVRVFADRVLELSHQVRIVNEPGEPDRRPGQHEQGDTDSARADRAPRPARRSEPDDERPQEELHGERHTEGSGHDIRAIAKAPGQRRGEREPERHVSGLDRRDHGRPHEQDAVAPPVAHAEDPRGSREPRARGSP